MIQEFRQSWATNTFITTANGRCHCMKINWMVGTNMSKHDFMADQQMIGIFILSRPDNNATYD